MTHSDKTTGSTTDQQNNDPSTGVLGSAADATGEIKDQAANLAEQVRQQALDQLGSQKDRVVDALETVALLLRQAGEHATQDDKTMVADYVDKGSVQVGRWAETLRNHDVPQLLEETRLLARRQPMLFFTGAIAAGFAGSRFLRTSAPQQESSTSTSSSSDSDSSDENQSAVNRTSEASSGYSTNVHDMPSDPILDIPAGNSGLFPDQGDTLETEGEFDDLTVGELDNLTRPENQ
jgi:hypothetical protein